MLKMYLEQNYYRVLKTDHLRFAKTLHLSVLLKQSKCKNGSEHTQ